MVVVRVANYAAHNLWEVVKANGSFYLFELYASLYNKALALSVQHIGVTLGAGANNFKLHNWLVLEWALFTACLGWLCLYLNGLLAYHLACGCINNLGGL